MPLTPSAYAVLHESRWQKFVKLLLHRRVRITGIIFFVLIAEDIVTTGLSFRETVEALAKLPGEVVGGACIIDRSGGRADVGCKLISLAQVNFPDYAPDDLPPEIQKIEAIKPGSRGLA